MTKPETPETLEQIAWRLADDPGGNSNCCPSENIPEYGQPCDGRMATFSRILLALQEVEKRAKDETTSYWDNCITNEVWPLIRAAEQRAESAESKLREAEAEKQKWYERFVKPETTQASCCLDNERGRKRAEAERDKYAAQLVSSRIGPCEVHAEITPGCHHCMYTRIVRSEAERDRLKEALRDLFDEVTREFTEQPDVLAWVKARSALAPPEPKA